MGKEGKKKEIKNGKSEGETQGEGEWRVGAMEKRSAKKKLVEMESKAAYGIRLRNATAWVLVTAARWR